MIKTLSFTLLLIGALPVWAEPTHAGKDGKALFAEKCGMCHRERGMGTLQLARRMPAEIAKLEDRDNLTEAYISFVVRNGLGIMYSISRAEVSDPQLKKIATYLSQDKTSKSNTSTKDNP